MLGWTAAALFSVFVLLFLLHSLGFLSLWMDEGFYYLTAKTILQHGYPLFPSGHVYYKAIAYAYILAFFSVVFGLNAFTLRVVSVLSTLGTFFLLYALCKKFFNRTIALTAVAVFSFSIWIVEYSRTALYFAPLQLISLFGVYAFYLGYFEERKRYKYLATAAFLAAPLVHQLGMGVWFCFPAFFLIRGAKRFFKKDVLLSFSATTLFYLLVQLHEFFFWKVGYVYYKSDLSFQSMIQYFFGSFSLDYFKEFFRSFPRMSLVVFAGIFLYLGIRLSSGLKDRLKEHAFEEQWFYLMLCLLLPLLFLGIFRTHVQPRYLYQLYPLFLILFLVSLYKSSMALIPLILSPLGLMKKSWNSILSLLLFLVFLFLTADGAGVWRSFRIVNRQYGERIKTDIITRSGRLEQYDHKDVGEYVRHYAKPHDVIVAIHVVFQYIYAGRVDYWLWSGGPGTWDAWEQTAEGWKDFYIGARWINNLTDLKKVIEDNPDRRVWVITSPSMFRRDHINAEIAGFFQANSDKLAFRGKDGMSEVYLWHESAQRLTGTQHSLEGEWLPSSFGKIVYQDAASRGSALFLDNSHDKKGSFWYPIKKLFAPGKYRLVFRVMTDSVRNPERILGVAVYNKGREKPLGTYFIAGNMLSDSQKYQDLGWSFYLPREGEIDLKILFTGKGNLWIDAIDITQAAQ